MHHRAGADKRREEPAALEANYRYLVQLRYSVWRNQSTSARTWTTPRSVIRKVRAAASERSSMRPGTQGPRSLMVTVTDFLVARSVTRTLVPNGRVRWAAVSKFRLNEEPLAVFPVRY